VDERSVNLKESVPQRNKRKRKEDRKEEGRVKTERSGSMRGRGIREKRRQKREGQRGQLSFSD
jgi:hypothetical protein